MERLRTGIENLDRILHGGIPLYSLNIVSGSPGSGKTILVQNIVFNNVKNGLRCLYMTTISESQLKLVRHLQEFRFFSDDFIGERFIYDDLGTFIREEGSARALEYIMEMVRKHRPNILVIDSFKAIRDMFNDEKAFKTFVFDLAASLSVWEVTVFLVGEYREEETNTLSEFATADGIFHLYGQEEKRFQKRYLRILKLRGTDFEQGEHLFEITSAGIVVYPRTKPEAERLTYAALQDKKPFGIPELDKMLDGGLRKGTVTLLSGGTGTGKTTFALKFLLEGAVSGERGLFISFEEPPNQLMHNASQLGWDLSRYVQEGTITLQFVSPIELDVDKHILALMETIEKSDIERLVLDSISSFESSVIDLQKYKDYLWALTQTLKAQGVTSIFTVLTEDLFSPVVVTKTQTSLLADNIIILRYVEKNSAIRKALSILKARGTCHSRDLREYEITPGGIEILGKLDAVDMLR